MHQAGVVRNDDIAVLHCRGRFEQSKLTGKTRRTFSPCLVVELPRNLPAERLIRRTSEEQYFCIQFLHERSADTGKPLCGPTLGEVAGARTEGDDLFKPVQLERREFSRDAKKDLIGDVQFETLAIVLNTEILQGFDVPIGHGHHVLEDVLLQLDEHRALKDPLIHDNALRTPDTAKVLASETVVQINEKIVALFLDRLLHPSQCFKSSPGIEFKCPVEVLIRTDEFGILPSCDEIDLTLGKAGAEDTKER